MRQGSPESLFPGETFCRTLGAKLNKRDRDAIVVGVRRWASGQSMEQLTKTRSCDYDIDYLLWWGRGDTGRLPVYLSASLVDEGRQQGLSVARALCLTLFNFAALLSVAQAESWPWRPAFFMPLKESPHLIAQPPQSPLELASSVHEMSAPGLAVLPWSSPLTGVQPYEEYRSSLSFTVFSDLHVAVWYVEGRPVPSGDSGVGPFWRMIQGAYADKEPAAQ